MLEHIFRNINDIRVIDLFYVEHFDFTEIEIDDIIKSLEYKECERIQIEDTVDHLVKQNILEKTYKIKEGYTCCKLCKFLDSYKLPRLKNHKDHKQYETLKTEFPYYKIANNNITKNLFEFLFEHMIYENQETTKDINNNIV